MILTFLNYLQYSSFSLETPRYRKHTICLVGDNEKTFSWNKRTEGNGIKFNSRQFKSFMQAFTSVSTKSSFHTLRILNFNPWAALKSETTANPLDDREDTKLL